MFFDFIQLLSTLDFIITTFCFCIVIYYYKLVSLSTLFWRKMCEFSVEFLYAFLVVFCIY